MLQLPPCAMGHRPRPHSRPDHHLLPFSMPMRQLRRASRRLLDRLSLGRALLRQLLHCRLCFPMPPLRLRRVILHLSSLHYTLF